MRRKYRQVYMIKGRPERSLTASLHEPGPQKFFAGCTRCGRVISFPIQCLSEMMMAATIEGRGMITSCPRCLKVAAQQFHTQPQIWKF